MLGMLLQKEGDHLTIYHAHICLKCEEYYQHHLCKGGIMPCGHSIDDGLYIHEKRCGSKRSRASQTHFVWTFREYYLKGYGNIKDVGILRDAYQGIFQRVVKEESSFEIEVRMLPEIIEDGEIKRRTMDVTFKRQLWPPPPIKASPHWCYINTLTFHEYDPEFRKVWEQRIPEADWLDSGIGGPRHESPFHCKVEIDPHWGWCLIVKTDHETADRIWYEVFMNRMLSRASEAFEAIKEHIQDHIMRMGEKDGQ